MGFGEFSGLVPRLSLGKAGSVLRVRGSGGLAAPIQSFNQVDIGADL